MPSPFSTVRFACGLGLLLSACSGYRPTPAAAPCNDTLVQAHFQPMWVRDAPALVLKSDPGRPPRYGTLVALTADSVVFDEAAASPVHDPPPRTYSLAAVQAVVDAEGAVVYGAIPEETLQAEMTLVLREARYAPFPEPLRLAQHAYENRHRPERFTRRVPRHHLLDFERAGAAQACLPPGPYTLALVLTAWDDDTAITDRDRVYLAAPGRVSLAIAPDSSQHLGLLVLTRHAPAGPHAPLAFQEYERCQLDRYHRDPLCGFPARTEETTLFLQIEQGAAAW